MIRWLGRMVWIGASLVALLVAAHVAIPTLIDTDAYKPQIIAQLKRATGRDVAIEGPVRLSLLPIPGVSFDGLRVSNVPASTNPSMVEVKTVSAWLSLLGLLTGELRPAEVTLVEPRVVLEIDASGRPNWQFPATPDTGVVSLPRLVVEQGFVSFKDDRSGLAIVAANAQVLASARSVDGPLSLAGEATVNNVPARIDLTVGAKSDVNGIGSHSIDVALQADGGRLSFVGTASELSPNARLTGRASASADNLVAFARALIAMAGQPQPPLPPLLAGKFRFDGPVELSSTMISANDVTLALADDSGAGSLRLDLKPDLTVEAKFAAQRLDLDRWLAALPLPDDLKDVPAPPAPGVDAAATPEVSWLAALTGTFAIKVDEVVYRSKAVRNLVLDLQVRRGLVAVPKFTASLPGDLDIQASSTLSGDPSRPTVAGSFSLEGQKLRETLSWLDVDVSSVPAGKLTRLSMKGRMGSSAGNITVSDAAFELDDVSGTGGILVAFTVPLSIVTHVELGRLDLDPYLPPPDRRQLGFHLPVDEVAPVLSLVGPSIGLKLKVDRVDWQGEAISGVELDVARAGGTLILKSFQINNLAGARASLRAAIANYWTKEPKLNVAFDFRAPDVDPVLKLVGQPPSGIGPLSMAGSAAGSSANLVVRDFSLNAMGWQVMASGVLAASGAEAGSVKRVSWNGDIRVDGQPIEAVIDANLSGARPLVDADLRIGVLDFGRFAARGRGALQATSIRGSEAIGTPLRSVDGTLKVSAASLGGAPLPLGKAEIAATLKDGVLIVSRFKGGLDGGTISLSGVIDGSKPTLSLDLTGEARGIDVAQLLRRQSGSNVIGSLITITVDGRLDATGVALRGAGNTVDEIRRSLAGAAELSGHIQARADRFLALLGSATTGAVGGVIDVTLGNIMSAFGDRGGVGAANLLNSISLVLHRYVNHDNLLAGHLDVAAGLVTDRNLTLRGNGAVANIMTRTSLSGATTDTTINFVLAEDPSAPYLIVTARGPIASPSFHAVRGQAADPPGIFDKMPSLPHVTVPSISVPRIPLPHIPNPFGR